jgi:glycosyltransferase involved in cell wall biosynthesis
MKEELLKTKAWQWPYHKSVNMEKLSVVIITFNEERNISRCIDSVMPFADEIIVLDSFSTDNTVAIAQEKGATIYQEPFLGYIEQKNRVTELASYNYIMSIDADEVADSTLQDSIILAKKTFTYSAYKMRRCTNHCGQFIRNGSWYPDRKIRIFDRRVAKWGGLNPHDKIVFKKPIAVKQLHGEILHYSYPTIDEHKAQNERFSTIVAESYHNAGKKTNHVKIVVNPVWAFFYGYVVRKGFMGGKQGLVIAVNQARYTFLKHRKLFHLQTGKFFRKQSDIQTTAYTNRLSRNIGPHIAGKEKTNIRNVFRRSKTA